MSWLCALAVVLVAARAGRAQQWEALPTVTTPAPVSDLTATTVLGGGAGGGGAGAQVYLFGGCNGTQSYNAEFDFYGCSAVTDAGWRFEVGTQQWVATPALPRPRYRHVALAFGSQIVLFGGRSLEDNLIPEVDEYDTVAQTWRTLGTMPRPVSDAGGFVLPGGLGYVVGGYNATYTALAATQTFAPGRGWGTAADMLEGRGDCAGAAVAGSGYVVGGFTHVNGFSSPLASVESYDALHDTWTMRAPLPEGRGDKAAVALNGRLHVVGGEVQSAGSGPLSVERAEAYLPAADRWDSLGEISGARFRFAGAAAEGGIYLFGGQGGLVGGYRQNGSFFQVLDTVERFTEPTTPSTTGASAAPSTMAATVTTTTTITTTTMAAAASTTAPPATGPGTSQRSRSSSQPGPRIIAAAVLAGLTVAVFAGLVVAIFLRRTKSAPLSQATSQLPLTRHAGGSVHHCASPGGTELELANLAVKVGEDVESDARSGAPPLPEFSTA